MGLALLPNTEDLHAEKDAEDRLCQGPQSVFELIDPEGHIYVTASSRCKR